VTRRLGHYRFVSDWCDWFAGNSNWFRGWRVAHAIDGFLEEHIRLVAEKVSVTSDLLRKRALAAGVPAERIVHIPEGAATDYIRPMCKRASREWARIPVSGSIVGAVQNGPMEREMRIFAQIRRQVPDVRFLLIGRISQEALRLANGLGIRDRLCPVGWVTDAEYPRYLACADVLICPLEEGVRDAARWPAKILDFLCTGRPVVTNAVGEVGELLRRNDIGIVAGESDAEFASAVTEALANRDLAMHLGAAARELMETQWDWSNRGTAIVQMLA
jgi:glycosyltransferase involved in cell wall biosynthesis